MDFPIRGELLSQVFAFLIRPCVVVLLLVTGAFSQTGTWVSLAPMPNPVFNATVGVIGTNIYVAGGAGLNRRAGAWLLIYDVLSDSWTTGRSMPGDRHGGGGGAIGGKFYVAAGNGNSGRAKSLVIYDPATMTWSEGAPIPVPVLSPGSAVYDGKLYIIGGVGDDGALGAAVGLVQIYDPTTNTWSNGAPMPTPRYGPGAAVFNGQIYVSGGLTSGSAAVFLTTLEVYDVSTNAWTTRASMPRSRFNSSTVAINGLIFVAGGFGLSNGILTFLSNVDVYDPFSNQWTTGPPLPSSKYAARAVVVNDRIYIVGGTREDVGSLSPGDFEPSLLTLVPASEQLRLDYIFSKRGGNRGAVTVQIIGGGFHSGATAKLAGIGPDIMGTNTSLLVSEILTTTFDLRTAVPGARNVVVTNPDGSSAMLLNAFTVEQGGAAQIWADVVGFDRIRANRPQAYYIVYGNKGNIDADIGHIWASFPSSISWKIGSQLQPTASSILQNGETIMVFDIFPLNAGSTGVISLVLEAPASLSTPFQLRAWGNQR